MDEHTHGEDDLFQDTQSDDDADTTASDTDQETDTGEQEQDTLNLEESTPKETGKAKADEAREQQAESWSRKIMNGEKSLDDLPANMKWLRPHIEAKLGANTPNLDAIVEKVVTEKEEKRKFDTLKVELDTLPKEQKRALEAKFKLFRAKGLSPLDSLETSMEALNISTQDMVLEAKRQAMRLRTPGKYKATANVNVEDLHKEGGYSEVVKNLPEAKRLEYLRNLRGAK